MTIDWNAFTPWSSLAGGALIGAAASALFLTTGRIAGISGIIGGLLSASQRAADAAWRIAFLVGLLASPLVYSIAFTSPTARIDAGFGTLIGAGFLVGIGSRYASGCTSGHGVCGLARFSKRSLIATLAFMSAGFSTVFVMRHVLV